MTHQPVAEVARPADRLGRPSAAVGAAPASTSAEGRSWALATPHAVATAAGEKAFRAGGTAIDAALAAAAALSVVYPHNCSIGGDVIALVSTPGKGTVAVDGSGAAAARTDADALRARYRRMPVTGAQAVTVPGALAAWETIHALGGRRPLARALDDAIEAAGGGIPVAGSLARALAANAGLLGADPGMRGVFFADEEPLAPGATLRQPALARSLEALAADGASAFYDGPLGESVVATLRSLGSALQTTDLHDHGTGSATPLRRPFRGLEVLTAPPASQGFVLLEILAAVDALGLAGPLDPLDGDAPLLAEIARLATLDRDLHLADPRLARVPIEELLGDVRARDLADRALRRVRRGGPAGAAIAAPRPRGDTVAVVAADAAGHAVSLIQSNFHFFGSGILDPATGIICHNRGASFVLDPSCPNVIAPGKRPLHTLMPVLVEESGELWAANGTMGGTVQPQIHAQVLLRLLAGASPQEAVGAPRWVVDGSGAERVSVEARVPEAARSALGAAGYGLEALPDLDEEVGHAQCLTRSPDGALVAASDPRSDGAASAG